MVYVGVPNDPNMPKRKAIEFLNLVVEGNVKLDLCGKFDRWMFDRVEFLGNLGINVRPPFKALDSGGMTISKSICHGFFDCRFVGVPRIRICDSKFISSVNMRIEGVKGNAMPTMRGLIQEMEHSFLQDSSVPVIELSGNRFNSIMLPSANNDNSVAGFNLGKARFVNGNHIGKLFLNTSIFPKKEPVGVNTKNPIPPSDVKFREVHFDAQESIKMPSDLAGKLAYKEYFIALKNQAIEKRDRDAEFNCGRKERYFDRGLATRWQEKFILGWSHYVSDSGISWIRPSVILFCGQWILAAIFIGGLCECGDYVVWFQAAVESLNPLSSLADIVKSPDCEEGWVDSLAASIYSEVRRIFTLALYYEIIKALRRYAK